MFYRKSRNITLAAMLMLLTGVQAQHSVTLSSQSLCAVTGSTVKIPCTFTPGHSSVTQREWYRVQSSEGEPRDLSKDPQYSGRVSVRTVTSDCELTVRNVRASDSGVYNFRFKTRSSDWISAPSGVPLTVTDLKVTVSDWESYKVLRCNTTCPYNPTYVWYRNGLFKVHQDRGKLYVNSGEPGSYSCAVRGHEELRSPAVCVLDEKSCWSVTYSTQNICSLIGSSVDIHSYYTFPNRYKVTEVFWFIKDQTGVEPVDVREDEEYQGRVQYTQISQNNCRLRITNLRERDAQTYRFRFYTDDPTGKYTGDPGVALSVTDLKVTVSDWSEQYMNLICITTCTLSNNPTYIWYKNGQRVSECKSASCSVAAVGGAVSYNCALEGHDSLLSPPVYSPKNTSAVVLSSGDTEEGDSVTLSCSSDANPPVLTYSWFKQRAAADTLLTTGQNYSISNISSQHSGLYYCTVHNRLGQHNSTPTHLDVKGNSTPTHLDVKGNSTPTHLDVKGNSTPTLLDVKGNSTRTHLDVLCISTLTNLDVTGNSTETHLDGSENSTVLKVFMVGLAVFLAVTLLSGALWMWKRKSSSANGHSSTGESGQRHSPAVYENVSASDCSGRVTSDDQDDVHYASVVFKNSHTQEVSPSPRLPPDTTEEEDVQYAAVNVSRSTAAIQLVTDEAADDPSQLYSKIQKLPTSAV